MELNCFNATLIVQYDQFCTTFIYYKDETLHITFIDLYSTCTLLRHGPSTCTFVRT